VTSARPRLLFATHNRGKLVELRQLLGDLALEVVCLDDLADPPSEVVEDGDTFAANAVKKALALSRATGLPALADDSGLEVDALGGAPGVRSARYSGSPLEGRARDLANIDKLLEALSGVPDPERGARFRSVVALADHAGRLGDQVLTAEGACEGRILHQPRGTGGFGYDPLFYQPDLGATFAEIPLAEKNLRSHRARAMAAMKPRLVDYFRLAKPGSSG
jgi:XTP/dITP diphosphohydrolase